MTDIHSHLLFSIDDGAKNIEESVGMLSDMQKDGITDLIVTPHFNLSAKNNDTLLSKSDENFVTLCDANKTGIKLYKGFEVRLSAHLLVYEEISKLTLAGSDYILLEYPYLNEFPKESIEIMSKIMRNFDLIPILAHVERYPFFKKNPTLLCDLIELGCLTQITASSIYKENSKFAYSLIENNLAHFIASDAHDQKERTPVLSPAFEKIEKKFGAEICDYFKRNAECVINKKRISINPPIKIKRIIGNIYI